MIGGAALGTFGCAIWLPLASLVVGGASQRPIVFTTAPVNIDNAGTNAFIAERDQVVYMVNPKLELIT